MNHLLETTDLKKFIVIGDRVLIKPVSPKEKTNSGLYLPPGVQEKEKIQSGFVIKVGPGYPIAGSSDIEESWKNSGEKIKYVPLQPREGDVAIYLQNNSYEIEFKKEKYIIVSQSSILLLIRDKDLFE